MKNSESCLTPREIVGELDRYVIGQEKAKRAVAIAIRNRWRRRKIEDSIKEEIFPKNILLIGPTGVGKTEIARRVAKLVDAPMVKVEATKFTEVGYVGRDVDSMVRDLVEVAVDMVRRRKEKEHIKRAEKVSEDRLIEKLLKHPVASGIIEAERKEGEPPQKCARRLLRDGRFDEFIIEIEVTAPKIKGFKIFSSMGIEEMDMAVSNLFENLMPKQSEEKKVQVKDAREILKEQELGSMIKMEDVTKEALDLAANNGIIFIDEIDKVAVRSSGHSGPDVSREGVQRDLLPLVEGCTVITKYGSIKTDHILFIAAGAFTMSKPSDLIPELQGRFPIRVELESLDEESFFRILTESEGSLIRQYEELLRAEGVELVFREDAIREIARLAVAINENQEDIGARRLHTVVEAVLDDISFEAPDLVDKRVVVDAEYVRKKIEPLLEDEDVSAYIL